MITPSFSPTATERVLPKLALDFTTANLDSRVTFTRTTDATHPATYVNSSGYVTAATNNQPRFDYNPLTLVCKGLLIEESRTNLAFYSEDFSQWLNANGNPTVSTDATVAPSNVQTADKIIASVLTNRYQAKYFAITGAAGTYTFSVFGKAAEYSYLQLWCNDPSVSNSNFLLAGGGSVVKTGTGHTPSIVSYGNGWYRCTITVTTLAANAAFYVGGCPFSTSTTFTGDGTSGVFVWGAQVEAGAFATSYIPTTTTALTRNADVATMTGTNFSDWYNATEGSLYAEGSHPAITSVPAEIGVGTLANAIQLYSDATGLGGAYIRSNSSTSANISRAGVFPANTNGKVIVGVKQNSFQVAGNGNLGGSDTSGNMPISPTALYIGRAGDSTAYWNGVLKNIRYYNIRLTNAELQAFSK